MRSASLFGLLVVTLLGLSNPAQAWGWRDHRTYHAPAVVHPIRQTYPVYGATPGPLYWRTGHWAHTWHGDRFGWWWVRGPEWTFYREPVAVFPPPQTTIVYDPHPAPQVTVVQTAPPVSVPGDQAPPAGNYYFCESSQLYYPYAKTCSERWKIVPNDQPRG